MEMEGMPLSLTFVSSVAFRNKVGGERESEGSLVSSLLHLQFLVHVIDPLRKVFTFFDPHPSGTILVWK